MSERASSAPPPDSRQRLVEVATAIGCGLIAALLGSGPAALRLGDATDSNHVWLSLAASALPATTIAVLVFREAYAGLRAFMGERRGFLRVFVSLWLGSFVPLLYVFGALLRTHTHHRPLAGVTFALVAVALVTGCGAFARRFAGIVDRLRASGNSWANVTVSSVVYGLAALALLAAARKLHGKLPVESAATMVDVTALALASALAARPELRPFKGLAVIGVVASAAVLVVGISRMSPELGVAIGARAPAFGGLFALFFGK